MPKVILTIAGTPYQLACEDGEEERLMQLGAQIDRKAEDIATAMGRTSDAKLILMAALILLDEASGSGNVVSMGARDLASRIQSLETMAGRLETIAETLESP